MENKCSYVQKIFKLLIIYKLDLICIIPCLVITTVATFIQPLVIREITDNGMINKNFQCILFYSCILLLSYIVAQAFNFFQTKIFIKIHKKVAHTLYQNTFEKLCHLPIEYFYDKNSAEIVNTIFTDIDGVSSVSDRFMSLSLISLFQVISGIFGLAIIDWRITCFILLAIPLKYFVIVLFSRKKSSYMKGFIENNQKFYSWLSDHINGIREIKLLNLLGIKAKEFRKVQETLLFSYEQNTLLDQCQSIIEIITDIIVSCILYIACGYLIVIGEFTIGGALAFMTYSNYVLSPISLIINIRYYLARIKPSSVRIFQFLDLKEEGFSKNLKCKRQEGDFNKNSKDEIPILEFFNVGFSYSNNKKLLKNISFKIYSGEKIAIVGNNGSGKTTIINLILGFYNPITGFIKFKGKRIDEMELEELRAHFSTVCQEPYLFYETIENNINIMKESNYAEVKRACKESGADDFIQSLPLGYKQKVGMDATKLSGGEKQKVAVARALLKEAEIYIFDEATAGYDIKSNIDLYKNVQENFKNKTAIFITHRYEELENVDRIIRLEDGKIID